MPAHVEQRVDPRQVQRQQLATAIAHVALCSLALNAAAVHPKHLGCKYVSCGSPQAASVSYGMDGCVPLPASLPWPHASSFVGPT